MAGVGLTGLLEVKAGSCVAQQLSVVRLHDLQSPAPALNKYV